MDLVGFLPFILIIVVFYFLLIRPQQKRTQAHQRLLASIEPGDEVVTIGGLFGDVVEIDENTVLLEVYDGTQMRFLRSAISRRVMPESDAFEDTGDDAAEIEQFEAEEPSVNGADVGGKAGRETNGDVAQADTAKTDAKAEEAKPSGNDASEKNAADKTGARPGDKGSGKPGKSP
jgi:preprotein translocase subunit YajC